MIHRTNHSRVMSRMAVQCLPQVNTNKGKETGEEAFVPPDQQVVSARGGNGQYIIYLNRAREQGGIAKYGASYTTYYIMCLPDHRKHQTELISHPSDKAPPFSCAVLRTYLADQPHLRSS